jgi:predicted kinase
MSAPIIGDIMQELIICRGIPACGKSTFANAWVKEVYGRVRVNRDDIRFQMYGVYFGLPIDEAVVTEVEDAMIRAALKAGVSVVVDDTNVNPEYLGRIATIGIRHGVKVTVKNFPIELDEALARNAKRDRKVPEDVIRKMHEQLRSLTWT